MDFVQVSTGAHLPAGLSSGHSGVLKNGKPISPDGEIVQPSSFFGVSEQSTDRFLNQDFQSFLDAVNEAYLKGIESPAVENVVESEQDLLVSSEHQNSDSLQANDVSFNRTESNSVQYPVGTTPTVESDANFSRQVPTLEKAANSSQGTFPERHPLALRNGSAVGVPSNTQHGLILPLGQQATAKGGFVNQEIQPSTSVHAGGQRVEILHNAEAHRIESNLSIPTLKTSPRGAEQTPGHNLLQNHTLQGDVQSSNQVTAPSSIVETGNIVNSDANRSSFNTNASRPFSTTPTAEIRVTGVDGDTSQVQRAPGQQGEIADTQSESSKRVLASVERPIRSLDGLNNKVNSSDRQVLDRPSIDRSSPIQGTTIGVPAGSSGPQPIPQPIPSQTVEVQSQASPGEAQRLGLPVNSATSTQVAHQTPSDNSEINPQISKVAVQSGVEKSTNRGTVEIQNPIQSEVEPEIQRPPSSNGNPNSQTAATEVASVERQSRETVKQNGPQDLNQSTTPSAGTETISPRESHSARRRNSIQHNVKTSTESAPRSAVEVAAESKYSNFSRYADGTSSTSLSSTSLNSEINSEFQRTDVFSDGSVPDVSVLDSPELVQSKDSAQPELLPLQSTNIDRPGDQTAGTIQNKSEFDFGFQKSISESVREILENRSEPAKPSEVTQIKLQINPPEFGPIEISISHKSGTASASIVVANEHVLNQLQTNLQSLETTLESLNVELQDITADERGERGSKHHTEHETQHQDHADDGTRVHHDSRESKQATIDSPSPNKIDVHVGRAVVIDLIV